MDEVMKAIVKRVHEEYDFNLELLTDTMLCLASPHREN